MRQYRFRYKLGVVIGINGDLFYWRIYVSLELDVWKKKKNIWKIWLTTGLKSSTQQQQSLS